jgi:hypothetical protein
MAQAGFTPISLYSTTTASAVPLAANLVSGELALNTTDGKMYFKNTGGVVTLLSSILTAVANGGTGVTTSTGSGSNVLNTSPSLVTPVVDSLNGGQLAGMRNRIINGDFRINQRTVSGTVTLAAGAYGHDRFKAGTGGCTYTFASSGNKNVITISAGSLIQVIEGTNIEGGIYRLSHLGTAQARIGVNGASPSAAFAPAGTAGVALLSTTATGGGNVTVEFSTGTVDSVEFELGSVATPFEQRPIGLEFILCQRYCAVFRAYVSAAIGNIPLPVKLRTPISSATVSGGGASFAIADGNTDTLIIASQPSASGQTLTVTSEL